MKAHVLPFAFLLATSSWILAADAEIKFVVKAENNAAAWKQLSELATAKHKEETVCFFETEKPSIGAAPANLILRARQKKGETGDSTVKVRSTTGAPPSGAVEKGIEPEEDWTDTTAPNVSRSLSWEPLPADVFAQVMKGAAKAESLFQGPQQSALLKERKMDFDWNALRRYGPLTAQVWKKKYRLSDDFPEVTVEKWLLEREGKTREMLELSVKLKDEPAAKVKARAAAFFKAVEDAGFGSPETTSKTKQVLEFYQPGQ